jgi:hypothetical protein
MVFALCVPTAVEVIDELNVTRSLCVHPLFVLLFVCLMHSCDSLDEISWFFSFGYISCRCKYWSCLLSKCNMELVW